MSAIGDGDGDEVDSGEPGDDSGGDGGLTDSGSPDDDTGDDPSDDTGEGTGDDTGEAPTDDARWCLDFEDGSLEPVGYAGSAIELFDGAKLKVVSEGSDYSALSGEELLGFDGWRALLMRSNDAGDTSSVSIATTDFFVVEDPHLWWWTLSEVDERGINLYADLLDENGTIVASLDLAVDTGGFVPTLSEGDDPIEGYEEITQGEPVVGELVQQVTDVSTWTGQSLRLRLYQHTRIQDNGFFTLFDDICAGTALTEGLAWGDPDPTH